MSDGFGDKARIGHLYPSGGLCDYEIQRMAPNGVQFLTTRLPFRDTSIESDKAIIANLEVHAALLADAKVDLIALNCTAAGVVCGSEQINRRIEASTGISAVNTIEAVLAGLAAVSARKIALLTPYRDEVVAAEIDYFASRGIEVTQSRGKPCATPFDQAMIAPRQWLNLAVTLRGNFDALLISCAGIRVSGVIEEIERNIGVPVIASNAALLWYCLSRLKLEDGPQSYGSLLAGKFPNRPPCPADRRES
ncbi:maleate isomerase [Paraburkholderia sp. BL27I4N3]|uniref:maleate cis-trans isomerase family protein n=1 Tax=Paraburkholderia sp. BL27I4N3 TaxID=1938805 RepID=UPI000E25389F|nr:aspartate/glutamate racemase family protein [Paraburkholderia sp. BL27I4N3]REE07348.1 maleate isomerase [Paraburkholderia sp. BL27I4N3]